MKKYSLPFAITIICILLWAGCDQRKATHEPATQPNPLTIIQAKDTTIHITMQDPENEVIRIANNDTIAAQFQLKINDGFYYTLDDLAYAALERSDNTMDGYYVSAFHIISDLTANGKPLSSDTWMHEPTLFINSMGVGQCDDEAAALVELWRHMGYKARLWKLEGHVVAEVWVDNHWEMFDPSFKVYYSNGQQQIASVEDLVNDPQLLQQPPLNGFPENPLLKAFVQSEMIIDAYRTRENNVVLETWETPKDTLDPIFMLPPGTTLTLPVYNWSNETHLTQHAYAHLALQPESTNVVSPLLAASIYGLGYAKYNGINHAVPPKNLTRHGLTAALPHTTIELVADSVPLEVYFQINPKAISFEKSNRIRLTGENLSMITVEAAPLDSHSRAIRDYNRTFLRNIKDDYTYYLTGEEELLETLGFNQDSLIGLRERMQRLVLLDERLDSTAQKAVVKSLNRKIDKIASYLIKANPIDRPVEANQQLDSIALQLNELRPFLAFTLGLKHSHDAVEFFNY